MTEKKNKVELLIWPILIALPDEDTKKKERSRISVLWHSMIVIIILS